MTITEKLEKWCSAAFPYVCTGSKTTSPDGAVRCECGAGFPAPAAPIADVKSN